MTRLKSVESDADEEIVCNSLNIVTQEGVFVDGEPLAAAGLEPNILVLINGTTGDQKVGAFGNNQTTVGGFSFNKNSTGVYAVHDINGPDNAPLEIANMVIFATALTANRRCEVTDITLNSFIVRTFNATTNAVADADFSAMMFAYGPFGP